MMCSRILFQRLLSLQKPIPLSLLSKGSMHYHGFNGLRVIHIVCGFRG
ncbi:hypothetical protein HanXRQr2_Chr09g0398871 [Helianthus annuus]|uniref:Uncharacterized protein n=1 Tax=Helianthus annuus TaxID=4232 RepID=A0A9K3N9A6_HELAN|nr:hypothetical protein HanXRQr2_Chr09g0398871 [Helianthus annuus]KAJ0894044.1 hypothetical protein HanPSC8_Chr09g0384641 [Helianthus annuus]